MAEYRDAKTYVVAWMSLFDNVIHQKQVKALHEYHALELADCKIFEPMEFHTLTSWEELNNVAFARAHVFSVLEVK